jgi:hypothetical protein
MESLALISAAILGALPYIAILPAFVNFSKEQIIRILSVGGVRNVFYSKNKIHQIPNYIDYF